MVQATTFAKNLNDLLSSSPMLRKKIAEEVGIAPSTLADYAYGRATPSPQTIKKLCIVLNCTYEELLGELHG